MQGILYRDSVPKLAVADPTAIAKTKANTRHITIRPSEKATEKNLPGPLLAKKLSVINKREPCQLLDHSRNL